MRRPALRAALGLLALGSLAAALHAQPAAGPTQVALGDGFGCGLAADGTVRCWGECGDGQCGSPGGDARTPRPVPGLSAVRAIDAGYGFACALGEDGQVRCWGDNGYGQLGVEGVEERAEPEPVPGVEGATAIALGSFHACALVEGGEVRCWGSNRYANLGVPQPERVRAEARPVPRLRATAIWSGKYHSCARDRRGPLVCWGSSDHGQVGTRRRVRRAGLTRVRGTGSVEQVSLGGSQSCVLGAEGELRCWGQNLFNVGEGSVSMHPRPVVDPRAAGAEGLSVYGENHCIVRGGQVLCWGVNRTHFLHVPTDEMGEVVLEPSAVPGLRDATAVELGASAVCARRASGQWVCWGRNRHGAVGVGSADPMVSAPTPLPW